MSTANVFAVRGACLRGMEAIPVTVEVSMASGLPGITVVGMASAAVLEARSRIRCALRAAGFEVPRKSITVNLAPSDVRKTGTGLDLPIAAAILACSGQIPKDFLDECLLLGELGLDGSVNSVVGDVAYQMLARDLCLTLVQGGRLQGFPIPGVHVAQVATLGALRGGKDALRYFQEDVCQPSDQSYDLDYSDVVGQEVAKRGLAIAAAGNLGALLCGSPGSGKTMLAQRLTTILTPISEEERLEALCVHSVAGESIESILAGQRPFRAPHHSISSAGLVGGGRPVRPGEISLAHGGALFLDELAEFSGPTLQMLRQPMESGEVRIVRADGAYRFPAHFQLIAASNPCPCGYLTDRSVACRCEPSAIELYRAKLSGPLSDRIDIALDVTRPDPSLIVKGEQGASSADLRALVEKARRFRAWRQKRIGDVRQQTLSVEGMVERYGLDTSGESALLGIAQRQCLSGRGIIRLVRVARTIADMNESAQVAQSHVLEASMFRGRGENDHGR